MQGLSRHNWIIETANDQTPAFAELDPNYPAFLSSSGAKKTSS